RWLSRDSVEVEYPSDLKVSAQEGLVGPVRVAFRVRQEDKQTQSLEAALEHYNRLVERMQSDSIAALFTPDGELGSAGQNPIVGPAAIAAYLHTFDQYKVLSEQMTVDSASIAGDTGFQRGRYAQTVILPSGDTVSVSGNFTVTWLSIGSGNWRVRRMG